jgi:RimJ/RimL family protein N-acetyltransferase
MTDLHVTGDVEEFAAAAEGYLLADPVRHNVALTVLVRVRAGRAYDGAPVFSWLTDDAGDVVASALCTPPFHALLATADASYAAALAPAFGAATGVIGRSDAAHAFAAALGRSVTVQRSDLQYGLGTLVHPPAPPGTPRPVTDDADVDLAVAWFEAFATEVGSHDSDHRGSIEHRLASGGAVWLWERGGEPVCLVGCYGPVGGVTRIAPVYTPAAHRRQGYAGATTAALTQHALDTGATAATLFTDAANPTSNGVYRRIGFREIGSLVNLRFIDAPAGSGSGR